MHNYKIISVYLWCLCVSIVVGGGGVKGGRTWRSLSTFNARAKAAVPNCPGAEVGEKNYIYVTWKGAEDQQKMHKNWHETWMFGKQKRENSVNLILRCHDGLL